MTKVQAGKMKQRKSQTNKTMGYPVSRREESERRKVQDIEDGRMRDDKKVSVGKT
jgi:hypothetical protein